jgi:hypothetical protein
MTRRKFEQVLTDLGYEHDRTAKHVIWVHPTAGEFVLSKSGEIKPWLVDKLRQRHPDHPVLKRQPGHGKGKHHRATPKSSRPRLVAVVNGNARPNIKQVAPRLKLRPEHTGCENCGRRWMSDLCPIGRTCPKCDGEIVLGRDMDRFDLTERLEAA